ncbi:MAG: FAD-dependent oxidoreductase, partial [Lentisphaerae bacterium]|nr:FAD-dependent oxidoreductase [Lentisphaerota bacterium]
HLSALGGPRESRRLAGDIVLSEDDILNRTNFADACVLVSWYLDRHAPAPILSDKYPEDPFLAVGIKRPPADMLARPRHAAPWLGIPYRCLYSRNIDNLFMAGRNISTSYRALGAVRVMRTCGMMGEAVGMAAAICMNHDCRPREVYQEHLNHFKTHFLERSVG